MKRAYSLIIKKWCYSPRWYSYYTITHWHSLGSNERTKRWNENNNKNDISISISCVYGLYGLNGALLCCPQRMEQKKLTHVFTVLKKNQQSLSRRLHEIRSHFPILYYLLQTCSFYTLSTWYEVVWIWCVFVSRFHTQWTHTRGNNVYSHQNMAYVKY